MATESQPIDIDDESDVVDLCDKSSEDDDDSVVDLTAASPASPKRRRSVIDVDDEAVARQWSRRSMRGQAPQEGRERDARIARKLAAEEKRKAEEKKRADAIKRKNAAERAAKENARADRRSCVDADGPRRDRHRVHARLEEVGRRPRAQERVREF